MNILVINAGSSSIKFTLYNAANRHPVAGGMVERIGQRELRFTTITQKEKESIVTPR